MPDEGIGLMKTELPLLYRPPLCFLPSIAIAAVFGAVITREYDMIPMVINVFIGTILGFIMGSIYAWADIRYVEEIAVAARVQPWLRTAANFMYPVIWDRTYAIRTVVTIVSVIVGMSGTVLALSAAYHLFPNARIPWAAFHGVSYDEVLINNIGRTTLFIYRWQFGRLPSLNINGLQSLKNDLKIGEIGTATF